jgi:hypothetical protein
MDRIEMVSFTIDIFENSRLWFAVVLLKTMRYSNK